MRIFFKVEWYKRSELLQKGAVAMREMRERIMTDGWRKMEGTLIFSVKQVELQPSPDEKAEGFFEISGTEGEITEGFVRSQDERMQCLTPYFHGGTERIEYRFDAAGMQQDEERSGSFFVVSNYGEFELPWRVKIQEKIPVSSLGEIRNLFHFTNLARANWQEAVKFFYTKEFSRICGEENEEMFNLYRGFSRNYGNEANVEEFLIAVNKKQPVSFSVQSKEIRIPEIRGHISEDIVITKNCWGPVKIQVEVKGDFLNVEKSWLGEDDFLGNQCRMSVFMDENRMHEGRNFGQVTLCYAHGTIAIPVIVERRTMQAKAKDRRSRELKKYNLRMVRLYQEFRMKRMDMKTWRNSAKECVEHMAHLSERSAVPKLFHAQLLMTEEKMEEAGWILDRVESYMEGAEPAVYCYYLYLTTLYNREEGYVRRVTQEVGQLFAQNPQEWRIAWLLLFLSRDLNRSAAKKWMFLEEQFKAGCTSPVLYLEALQLLNANPTLLLKLDSIAKQILMYGARNKYLSADLTGHVIYLINREKYYDPVLLEILKLSWEKCQDTDTLQAICALLIKGGKSGTEYYPWYLKGVQKKLRITRLYEHYMMSVDLSQRVEIPKIVLLYFAYQSNLDNDYAAYLYAYVERHREEDPDLYIAYRPQIDRFVLSQLYKGRINRHLAYLYRVALTGPMLTPENARALAALLASVEVFWQGEKKKLIVVHARLKGEKVYVLRDGRAYVDLYSRQDMLFVEDEAKNRHLINSEAVLTPMFENTAVGRDSQEENLPDLEDLKGKVAAYAKEQLPFQLKMTDVQQVVIRPDNADSYLAIAQEPALTKAYGRKVRAALLHYFFDEGRTEDMDQLLKGLEPEDIDRADRADAVRYLVLQGFYEKAYAWLKGMDFEKQDARILMRLCSRLLEQQLFAEDDRMTQLCFWAAVHGKYDGLILQQLTDRFEGSVNEMEALKNAAEGFGINTYPLCERIMEQMLYTQKDVTERMDLLRQYVAEGGRSELEGAFLHRCAYSYVLGKQPIHIYMIHDILRMYKSKDPVTDMCKIACLQYYAKNKSAMDETVRHIIKDMAACMLRENKILPVLKEFADIVPGAEFLLDKTFIVYCGSPAVKAILNYRILKKEEEQEDYQSMEMLHVYEGISVMTFILFPGETLQYFVTEAEGAGNIADSGILKAEECNEAAKMSRYGMLSEVTRQMPKGSAGRGQEWQSLESLNRYLYTDYCVNALFEAQE